MSFIATRLRPAALAAAALSALVLAAGPVQAAGEAEHPIHPENGWPFAGPLGRFDKASLQRGFQVYTQVCAACHSMRLLHYRNLGDDGGPGYDEDEVKAIAANYQVPAGPDEYGNEVDEYGQPLTRPARPEDRFKMPYPNETAARAANGGAYPPDLSVITKARHGGADYVYSLLQGYKEPPEDVELRAGAYYNIYFPGKQYAMPQPLYDDLIEYTDGTPATIEQMSYDVTQFLHWAAEPKMEERKKLGLMVMIYLSIFAVLLYLSYRRIWRNVDH
ncbi:MAG: cytochrome c1 [Alphaproteobacteria bacterium]